MKKYILIIFFLVIHPSCTKKKTGCMDYSACNYDLLAELNDDSCVYPKQNHNCNGECIAELDCSGVCGGDDIHNIDCGGSCNNENVSLWGKCFNIKNTFKLNLGKKELSGKNIPKEIGELINLTEIRLYKANLIGNIPKEIGKLNKLENLTLSYNRLTGPIPRELGDLVNLKRLYLNNNNFTGKIPNTIKDLSKLNTLYLGNNKLSGIIPGFICELELSFFNNNKDYLANNAFCPPYPKCISKKYIGYQRKIECIN
ncbi:MAG: hypothetical protein CMF96_04755 [Candidatus Marinimicrobia bacterium]|nr:hypothetical protein [Candidatus Neomarinimicrobiota bacterium]|tara:strand:- start:397 stop:1164 length:768 start_codon:yes stop_codon:yes gene_type:complete